MRKRSDDAATAWAAAPSSSSPRSKQARTTGSPSRPCEMSTCVLTMACTRDGIGSGSLRLQWRRLVILVTRFRRGAIPLTWGQSGGGDAGQGLRRAPHARSSAHDRPRLPTRARLPPAPRRVRVRRAARRLAAEALRPRRAGQGRAAGADRAHARAGGRSRCRPSTTATTARRSRSPTTPASRSRSSTGGGTSTSSTRAIYAGRDDRRPRAGRPDRARLRLGARASSSSSAAPGSPT